MKRLLAAALSLAAPAAVAAEIPGDVVARIYREEGAVIAPAKLPGYYSRDLAKALRKDQAAEGVGAIGFDWRYDSQDPRIENGQTTEEVAGGPHGSLIEVKFIDGGAPRTVNWLLCRRPNGDWRVSNVYTAAWNLRAQLDLPPEPITC